MGDSKMNDLSERAHLYYLPSFPTFLSAMDKVQGYNRFHRLQTQSNFSLW